MILLCQQLGILLSGELQLDGASTHADPVLNCLTTGEIEVGTAVPSQVQYLQFTLKHEMAG